MAVSGSLNPETPSRRNLWAAQAKTWLSHRDCHPAEEAYTLEPKGTGYDAGSQRRPDPRALGESARRGVFASGASAQTARLIGPVGAPRATGSRSSWCPPRHQVSFIRMTVGHGKSRVTRARRKQSEASPRSGWIATCPE